MELHTIALLPSIIEIAFIDLVLSGDNALVIALATRSLAPELRGVGIVLGTAASLLIRIVATAAVGLLLAIPFLKLAAAISLLYVAVKLVLPEDEDDAPDLAGEGGLWTAIRLIVVADIAMSLDNVLAVAGAADGSFMLILFGLAFSMPLLMFGSTVVARIIDRVPLLVPLGGTLLGWIAGSIAVSDPIVADFLEDAPAFTVVAPLTGALFVVMLGRILERQMLERRARDSGGDAGPLEDQLPVS